MDEISKDDMEAEMRRLEEEEAKLDRQLELKRKAKKLEEMKKRIEMKQRELSNLDKDEPDQGLKPGDEDKWSHHRRTVSASEPTHRKSPEPVQDPSPTNQNSDGDKPPLPARIRPGSTPSQTTVFPQIEEANTAGKKPDIKSKPSVIQAKKDGGGSSQAIKDQTYLEPKSGNKTHANKPLPPDPDGTNVPPPLHPKPADLQKGKQSKSSDDATDNKDDSYDDGASSEIIKTADDDKPPPLHPKPGHLQQSPKEKYSSDQFESTASADLASEAASDSEDENQQKEEGHYSNLKEIQAWKSKLDTDQLYQSYNEEKNQKALSSKTQEITIFKAAWADLPEVKDSGVLQTMPAKEKKLQERMFEVITSEYTYLKTLEVLCEVFIEADGLNPQSQSSVITEEEQKALFGNLERVRDVSNSLLTDMVVKSKEQNFVLTDICDIIYNRATRSFSCFESYCSHMPVQLRKLESLRKDPGFSRALVALEQNKKCKGMKLESFLVLPKQRITTYSLLVASICDNVEVGSSRHKSAIKALKTVDQVAIKCERGFKRQEQKQLMKTMVKQLDYRTPTEQKAPIDMKTGYLVKQGQVQLVTPGTKGKLPFVTPKPGTKQMYLILLNHLILITRKKGDKYTVTNFAEPKNLVVQNIDKFTVDLTNLLPYGKPPGCDHMFTLKMKSAGPEKIECEIIFSCESRGICSRWVDAITMVQVGEDNFRVYDGLDDPQYQCIEEYIAQEPDELDLSVSEVVIVANKPEADDGWFQGQRIRDEAWGWFPSRCLEEITQKAAMKKNVRLLKREMTRKQEVYSVPVET